MFFFVRNQNASQFRVYLWFQFWDLSFEFESGKVLHRLICWSQIRVDGDFISLAGRWRRLITGCQSLCACNAPYRASSPKPWLRRSLDLWPCKKPFALSLLSSVMCHHSALSSSLPGLKSYLQVWKKNGALSRPCWPSCVNWEGEDGMHWSWEASSPHPPLLLLLPATKNIQKEISNFLGGKNQTISGKLQLFQG